MHYFLQFFAKRPISLLVTWNNEQKKEIYYGCFNFKSTGLRFTANAEKKTKKEQKRMVKIQKALKISKEVYDDIDKKTRKDNFNISEWVELTYIKEFMTESAINIQMAFNEKKIDRKRTRLNSSQRLIWYDVFY